MIKFIPNLKHLRCLFWIFLLNLLPIHIRAQLPDDYISKVQYQEKTEVVYELIDDSSYKCLSTEELSKYHSSFTIIDKCQLIDFNGELHTNDVYLEEHGVRDDWMQGIGRIYAGPEFSELYSPQEQLLYRKETEPDPDIRPITEHEALRYWNTDINDSTLLKMYVDFNNQGIPCTIKGGILNAHTEQSHFIYDHNTRTYSSTEYDVAGQKKKEHLSHYRLNDDDVHYADTEVIIEWIRTENGCCVRKTTTIYRYNYSIVIHPDFQDVFEQQENTGSTTALDNDVQITLEQIAGKEEFMVQGDRQNSRTLFVRVFDLTGRIVLETHTRTGQPIGLPQTTQTGMYLVHIFGSDQTKPLTGKVIISSSNNQF